MKTFVIVMLVASVMGTNRRDVIGWDAGDDWVEKAAFLAGASEVEELSEEVMERFSSFRQRPLDINAATRGRLIASGMLTDFQADALIEYRSFSGDIMSFAELALVPGFSAEYAEALRPFVILQTSRPPGHTDRGKLDHSVTFRSSLRCGTESENAPRESSFGLKYAARYSEKAELLWSSRTTYDDSSVRLGTVSAAIYGRRSLGKLVVGNYNARFGQGLAQWSGFCLSGYPTVSAFRKNGTGISPTGSYSPELNGAAADFTLGHFTLTGAVSIGGDQTRAISNLKWTSRRATLGATCVWSPLLHAATFSTDWRIGLPGLSFFGEAAAKAGVGRGLPSACVAGVIWSPVYGTRLALTGRYYDASFKSDWSGAALGFEMPWLSATLDAARNVAKKTDQYKTVVRIAHEFKLDSISIAPSVRLNARVRPEDDLQKRIDLRGDLAVSYGPWRLNGRYNVLWCSDFAWLWYLEPGRVVADGKLKTALYSRFSLFCVDSWDDRIYVYERDAPGTFNVPSYYGRGFALSAAGSLKLRRHAVYLRTSWISYPWNVTPKPGRFEVRLQYSLSITGRN